MAKEFFLIFQCSIIFHFIYRIFLFEMFICFVYQCISIFKVNVNDKNFIHFMQSATQFHSFVHIIRFIVNRFLFLNSRKVCNIAKQRSNSKSKLSSYIVKNHKIYSRISLKFYSKFFLPFFVISLVWFHHRI